MTSGWSVAGSFGTVSGPMPEGELLFIARLPPQVQLALMLDPPSLLGVRERHDQTR